jgi:hypothetical protein
MTHSQLDPEVLAASIVRAMMMEAANTSETSVNFYQTTRRYNPQDSHLHSHSCENLKSHCLHIVYDRKVTTGSHMLTQIIPKFFKF